MGKVLKYGIIGWLVFSVITFPFYWPYIRMVWVFIPNIPAAKYETPITDAQARLQDIDYLSTLTKYDRSFSDDAQADFAAKIATLRNEAAGMSDAQFYLAIAEAVALADNGHTNVSYRPQYTEFNTIGARLYAFSDGVYILSAAPDKAHTIGRRVVSVEGMPIDALRTALGKYRGGNETWRSLYSTFLIESPDLLDAAGQAGSPKALELTIASGAVHSDLPVADAMKLERVQFTGLSVSHPEALSGRSAWQTLVPGRAYEGFSDWSHVLEGEDATMPRYLTTPAEPLFYPLDHNGFYIRALPGFAAGDQSIKNAYKSMLAEHPAGSLDYLVVDFRLHDGGDYTKSMAFAKAAPKVVNDDGAIYIITGPNTFSAAIVTVAMLKYYAAGRAIIIGEQMGDREQFWAERGSSFRLPNSGYYINYATGYHDWEDGCKGEPYCYTMNEMYEVPAGSLAPEVELPQDFKSYRRGQDVVMDWIDQQRGSIQP